MIDRSHILNELKRHKKFNSNAEYARFLQISPQNLANWYKRNTFDVNLIANLFTDVNKSWLLTGEGEMLKQTDEQSQTNEPMEGCACPFTESMKGILENMTAICDVNKRLVDQQSELIATIKALATKK